MWRPDLESLLDFSHFWPLHPLPNAFFRSLNGLWITSTFSSPHASEYFLCELLLHGRKLTIVRRMITPIRKNSAEFRWSFKY